MVLVPIAVIAGLVHVVRTRAEAQAAARRAAADAPTEEGGQSPTRSSDAPSDPNFPTKSS